MRATKFLHVISTHFAAHQLIAQKRRIADDDITRRPFAFCVKFERVISSVFARLSFFQCFCFAPKMRNQEGVFVLEMVQLLEHGIAFVWETVVASPFQITDLHGNLCEFERVGVEFDGFELLHVHARFEIEAELCREGDEFLFKIEKQLKRDIKEVAAAARGIEHRDAGELVMKGGRSEEHTSELQSQSNLVCRLLLEKKN